MNHTLIIVLQGATLLGITSGMLGTFALLRQQSLLGDAISHAALPGIVMMFLCTYSTNPWILLCGGAIAGIVGVLCMNYICAHTKLKKDAILGIILSVFFGLGLVLMTIAQKIPVASQAVLNKFLFGTIATMLTHDIQLIAVISCFIFGMLLIFWKECSMYVFDSTFTRATGFNVKTIEAILTILLVLAIVIGLQTVGVVLMSTMLIAPAAAARQWTKRLSHMTLLAGFLGGLSAAIGVCASSAVDHLPTGPAIVVVASVIVFTSLICGPKRSLA
jgi:manganese/zinc/iron transport system permease protein